jgi:hypothetical protein
LFPALIQRGFRLDYRKIQISFEEVKFLSHVFRNGTHYPSPTKVQGLLDLEVPKSKDEVASFLGMFAYFSQFIPHYSELCRPLNKLKRESTLFRWTKQHQAAFLALKYELLNATVLFNPSTDPDHPYVVMTDASDTTISSCLGQKIGNKIHPIAFNSRLLTSRERRNYCIYQKEFLAVLEAYERYHLYIDGHKTYAYCDNQAVCMIARTQNPSARLARWIARLLPYAHIPIKYIQSSDNKICDHLSRSGLSTWTQFQPSMQLALEKLKILTLDNPFNPRDDVSDCFSKSKMPKKKVKSKEKVTAAYLERTSPEIAQFFNNNHVQIDPAYHHNFWKISDKHQIGEHKHVNVADQRAKPTPAVQSIIDIPSILLAQETDDFCKHMKHFIETGHFLSKPPPFPPASVKRFCINTLGLLEFNFSKSGKDNTSWRIYAPSSIHKKVLLVCHNHPTSGHYGYSKTINIVRKHFYWPKMFRTIQDYCRACETCQLCKYPTKLPQGEYRPHIPTENWESVHIDLAGRYPTTKQGYKYIFVMYDQFSKTTALIPLKNKSANAIVTALRNMIHHGLSPPRRFILDADKGFNNAEFQRFATQYSIVLQTVPVRAHQANNAEIRIKKVVEMLRTYIKDHSRDDATQGFWFDGLVDLVIALNSIKHDSTQLEPWQVLFGKKHSSPLDYTMHPKTTFSETNSISSSFLQRRERTFDLVRDNIKQTQDGIAKQYQKRVQPITMKIGDKVKYKSSFQSNLAKNFNAKLAPKYDAVFTIIDFKDPTVVLIQRDVNPWNKPKEAHVTHLMPWFSAKSTQPPSVSSHHSLQTNVNSDSQSIQSLPVLSTQNNNSIPSLSQKSDMYIVPSLNSSRARYTRMLRNRGTNKVNYKE